MCYETQHSYRAFHNQPPGEVLLPISPGKIIEVPYGQGLTQAEVRESF